VKLSPDGRRVAYLLKSPNLTTNKNDYQLRVRDLEEITHRENGRLLFQSDELSEVTWVADGRYVTFLNREKNKSRIIKLDIETGKMETVCEYPGWVREYSIGRDGDVVAFATKLPPSDDAAKPTMAERGYVIPFGYPASQAYERVKEGGRFAINLLKRTKQGNWEAKSLPPQLLAGSGRKLHLPGFAQASSLSVSPDGKYLAFSFILDELPEGWEKNRAVQWARSLGSNPFVLGLYDLQNERFRLALEAPRAEEPSARWSGDSRAIAIIAASPVRSMWEKQDVERGFDPSVRHLFTVSMDDLSVSQVLPSAVSERVVPVFWKQANGEMIVPVDPSTFVRLKRSGPEWQEEARFSLSTSRVLSSETSNGERVVGQAETVNTPPDLFLYVIASNQEIPLTEFNSEIAEVTLGTVERIDLDPVKASGYLVKPIDYRVGTRYPLVIMPKSGDGFICDGGYNTTALAPQPLANAGFVVLAVGAPSNDMSGTVQEAENWMRTIETTVDFMDRKGLANRDNVGLVGFSRTSWKTDFTLTHSNLQFAAASSADGGAFNYGSYWLFQENEQDEKVYGGPPYGKTFKNWLQYAPAFNADKIKTPLLMEYTSNGGAFSEPIYAYEFFTALRRQNKLVELFWYPTGDHQLDTPFERQASLQRNVDWFRFWLQGYEGKAPEYDPDQYVRWRKLRDQQEWNKRAHAEGPGN